MRVKQTNLPFLDIVVNQINYKKMRFLYRKLKYNTKNIKNNKFKLRRVTSRVFVNQLSCQMYSDNQKLSFCFV